MIRQPIIFLGFMAPCSHDPHNPKSLILGVISWEDHKAKLPLPIGHPFPYSILPLKLDLTVKKYPE
jgi:hypothetical protein